VSAGQTTAFTVTASGAPPPAYQWEVSTDDGGSWTPVSDSAPYSGATTATLLIADVPFSLDRTQYRAVASNASGSATSGAAALWVAEDPTGIFWRDPAEVSSGDSGGTLDGTDVNDSVTPVGPPPPGGAGGGTAGGGPLTPGSTSGEAGGAIGTPSSRPRRGWPQPPPPKRRPGPRR
jgi:hypothetical protein